MGHGGTGEVSEGTGGAGGRKGDCFGGTEASDLGKTLPSFLSEIVLGGVPMVDGEEDFAPRSMEPPTSPNNRDVISYFNQPCDELKNLWLKACLSNGNTVIE